MENIPIKLQQDTHNLWRVILFTRFRTPPGRPPARPSNDNTPPAYRGWGVKRTRTTSNLSECWCGEHSLNAESNQLSCCKFSRPAGNRSQSLIFKPVRDSPKTPQLCHIEREMDSTAQRDAHTNRHSQFLGLTLEYATKSHSYMVQSWCWK